MAPLSFAQQGIWIADQAGRGGAAYNLPLHARLRGALDREILHRALEYLLKRHDALRTVFVTGEDGLPVQRLDGVSAIEVPFVDLADAPTGRQAKIIERYARDEATTAFDLSTAPLLRARLLRRDADDHVLLLTVHHIAADGASARMFHDELLQVYGALSAGKNPELPATPIRYLDYAIFEREERADTERTARGLAFWKDQLAGHPGVLDLPTDARRGGHRSSRAAEYRLRLPDDLGARLRELARSSGCTAYMVLLAAFGALLSRWTDQRDILIGSPIDNRALPETEHLVGLFVNTVVMRLDLDDTPTFAELLTRVRQVVLDALAHQDSPFELVVKQADAERRTGRPPLVQAMFALQDGISLDRSFGSLESTSLRFAAQTAKFDLTLFLVADGSRVEGHLEYDRDLFHQDRIAAFAEQYQILLKQVIVDPAVPIDHLPLLPPAARSQRPRPSAMAHPPVHQLVEQQARLRPDSPAVVFGDTVLSYRELNARSDALACTLAGLGVGPEQTVGVVVEESPDAIVALLAVLKAGGAYVPVDAAEPRHRLEQIADQARWSVIITRQDTANRFGFLGVRLVEVDGSPDGTAQLPVRVAPHGGNLAYVLFTSGSTGTPKGVAVPHHALAAYTTALVAQLDLPAGSSWAMVQSLTVDGAMGVVWPCLAAGGRLEMVPRSVSTDADAMRGFLTDHAIDFLKIAPSHLAALASPLPSRCLMVGGEPANADWLRQLKAAAPGCRIINHYGPTETTIGVLTLDVSGEQQACDVAPLGVPLGENLVHVVDAVLQRVPVGVVGEILVSGPQVTRGYLARAGQTADVFVPDPFSGVAGARAYRTGDLGRYRPDGTIEFVGRSDDQIKIRAYRIEPGEVEAALNADRSVAHSLVTAMDLGSAGTCLVGYVVPRPGHHVDAAQVRRRVAGVLPGYMVPTAVMVLDALPRTPHGKIDRRALPCPAVADTTPVEHPVGAHERAVAQIWASVLGRDLATVGRDADFFDAGGHSLLAMQLVARLRSHFVVDLPMQAAFDSPTVRCLARDIASLENSNAAASARMPITPADREFDLPLSYAQQRLWFLTQLDPEIPIYNVPIGLRVSGPLDLGAVEEALSAIVRRHEVLRTVYPTRDGIPVQQVRAPSRIHVPVLDLGVQDRAAADSELTQWLRRESQRPFDLEHGPLIRAGAVRLADEQTVLLITVHHIVFDRWSRENFQAELSALYRACVCGEQPSMPTLPIQYADYAVWQRGILTAGLGRRQMDYWRRQLENAPGPVDLESARQRPVVRTYRGDYIQVDIPTELTDTLRELARREGVTLFMVLLAVFQVLVACAGRRREFIIGTPIANRSEALTEPLIGFFANTLALRADLRGDPTFRELLRRVRRVTVEAYQNQDVPFDKIVEELRPERNPGRDPYFDIMLTFLNVPPGAGLSLPGVTVEPLRLDEWIAKRDLTMRIEDGPIGLAGIVEYDTDILDRDTVRHLTDEFVRLLFHVSAHPESTYREMTAERKSRRGMPMEQGTTSAASRLRFQQMLASKTPAAKIQASVTETLLEPGTATLPLVMEAQSPDIDLVAWATDSKLRLDAHLERYGAVLFRGFRIDSVAYFEQVIRTQVAELVEYRERSTPRHVVEGNVYTSTEYPADQFIMLHNEMSYAHSWPLKLGFYCRRAAETGGATPVADSREVYRRLDPALRRTFEEKGVMYLRNFGGDIDLSWQDVFQTADRAEVERYCAQAHIQLSWGDGDRLHTHQVRAATATHPKTGETVWFNSAHMFHIAGLDKGVRASLRSIFPEGELPRHAQFGDGTAIDDDMIEHIRSVYSDAAVRFPWREGDILLLDNMLAAHGREPYAGPREVLVAMGGPVR